MMLTLGPGSIVQLSSEIELPPSRRDTARQSLTVETLDPALLDAALRLVKLLDEPDLALRLAPLVQQEIAIRLLRGPHGPHLRRLGTIGSPSQQIAKAVTWLKRNFVEPLRVDDLADRAHMSPSTLRQHFRAITGLSPLQFQKQLRLQEARQLMLSQSLDAGSAAARVGYQSASQFSREYGRLFGAPPQRDIRRMRQT
jgi:transcriptional regulator GlxA family with amidase domain